MQKQIWTKVFAVTGTVLAGIPILFTVVTGAIGSAVSGRLLVDYLMPAELFIFALAGGLLLLWAAFRAKLLRKTVIAGLVAACVFLALCNGIAMLSGMATDAAKAVGVAWAAVIASLALYTLAVIELTIAGIVISKKVFARPNEA